MDKFSRTKYAPLKLTQNYDTPTQRIACNYTPSASQIALDVNKRRLIWVISNKNKIKLNFDVLSDKEIKCDKISNGY